MLVLRCFMRKCSVCLRLFFAAYVLCEYRLFLVTCVVLIVVKIQVLYVGCSGEVYLELLCGIDATVGERGRIWVHFSTLHGSRKDSFGK